MFSEVSHTTAVLALPLVYECRHLCSPAAGKWCQHSTDLCQFHRHSPIDHLSKFQLYQTSFGQMLQDEPSWCRECPKCEYVSNWLQCHLHGCIQLLFVAEYCSGECEWYCHLDTLHFQTELSYMEVQHSNQICLQCLSDNNLNIPAACKLSVQHSCQCFSHYAHRVYPKRFLPLSQRIPSIILVHSDSQ